jgi:hypothetical protein
MRPRFWYVTKVDPERIAEAPIRVLEYSTANFCVTVYGPARGRVNRIFHRAGVSLKSQCLER